MNHEPWTINHDLFQLFPHLCVSLQMGKVHVLQSVQKIPASLQETWDFFSDPHNLLALTPPALNLQPVNEIFGENMYVGQVILYTVRPIFNIPFPWMTVITHVEPMKMFIDEQRKGPYSLWHHQHHFKEVDGGVEMTDLIHYSLPFGLLGNMGIGIVQKKLGEIFEYRRTKVQEIFGIGI